jgi:hypothetical protein
LNQTLSDATLGHLFTANNDGEHGLIKPDSYISFIPVQDPVYIAAATYNTILHVIDSYIDRFSTSDSLNEVENLFDNQVINDELSFGPMLLHYAKLRKIAHKTQQNNLENDSSVEKSGQNLTDGIDNETSSSSSSSSSATIFDFNNSPNFKQIFILDTLKQFKNFILNHSRAQSGFAEDRLTDTISHFGSAANELVEYKPDTSLDSDESPGKLDSRTKKRILNSFGDGDGDDDDSYTHIIPNYDCYFIIINDGWD